jgi:hypothetical protein
MEDDAPRPTNFPDLEGPTNFPDLEKFLGKAPDDEHTLSKSKSPKRSRSPRR